MVLFKITRVLGGTVRDRRIYTIEGEQKVQLKAILRNKNRS